MPNPEHDLTRNQIEAREIAMSGSDSNDHFGERKSNKSAARAAQDQEDYEARKEHSNSGSNTHSGKGMEYVTRKTGSSREDEEGVGAEVVH